MSKSASGWVLKTDPARMVLHAPRTATGLSDSLGEETWERSTTDLLCSGKLRSVWCQYFADVSAHPFGQQDSWPSKMGPIGCPETLEKYTTIRCIISQKSAGLIFPVGSLKSHKAHRSKHTVQKPLQEDVETVSSPHDFSYFSVGCLLCHFELPWYVYTAIVLIFRRLWGGLTSITEPAVLCSVVHGVQVVINALFRA